MYCVCEGEVNKVTHIHVLNLSRYAVEKGKRAEKGLKAESKSTCRSDVTRGKLSTRKGTVGATRGVCVCMCASSELMLSPHYSREAD